MKWSVQALALIFVLKLLLYDFRLAGLCQAGSRDRGWAQRRGQSRLPGGLEPTTQKIPVSSIVLFLLHSQFDWLLWPRVTLLFKIYSPSYYPWLAVNWCDWHNWHRSGLHHLMGQNLLLVYGAKANSCHWVVLIHCNTLKVYYVQLVIMY